MSNQKFANKERGLKLYCVGKDVFGNKFFVQDGSFVFAGVRIYHYRDGVPISECLSLNRSGARRLIAGLEKFINSN